MSGPKNRHIVQRRTNTTAAVATSLALFVCSACDVAGNGGDDDSRQSESPAATTGGLVIEVLADHPPNWTWVVPEKWMQGACRDIPGAWIDNMVEHAFLELGDRSEVPNCPVLVSRPGQTPPANTDPATHLLQIRGGVATPPVSLARKGDTLKIEVEPGRASDHSYQLRLRRFVRPPAFEPLWSRSTKSGTVETVKLDRVGLHGFDDELYHPWIRAWIVVTSTPRMGLTDQNGEVRFNELPVGRYTVRVKHPLVGNTSRDVEIVADKTTEISIVIKTTEDK